MCPAVPTVSATSRLTRRAAATAAATASTSSSASARTSRSRRPSRTIPTTAGSPSAERLGQLLLDRAGEGRELGKRKRSAADARDRLLDLAADEPGKPLGARAHGRDWLGEHPQHRDLGASALRDRGRARALPRARRA